MQEKKIDFQSLGICHRFFNFVMNSLIGVSLKRVILGQPMPQGSTNDRQLDEHARSGVQEPLISHAKPNGEERAISQLKDDSDSIVQIHFKQTEEELDDWTPVDKLCSSIQVAAKDEKAVERWNEFIDDKSGKKEIPLLNGISLDANKPKIHGKTGSKIIIPITESAGQDEKQKKAGNKFPSPKLAKPMLTGLGLNVNEISETFIQNTRERLSGNVSLIEPAESYNS